MTGASSTSKVALIEPAQSEAVTMSGFTLSAFFLCIAITLSILGATIAAWLQRRNWEYQSKQQLKAEQKQVAQRTVQELAHLVDARLYRQRQFLWKIRSGTQDELEDARKESRKEYRAAIRRWNDNFGRIKASLYISFQRHQMMRFEQEIHATFQDVGSVLEQIYHGKRSKSLLTLQENRLNRLSLSASQFLYALLRQIDEGHLGEYRKETIVAHHNWSNLSNAYLVKRLFGVR